MALSLSVTLVGRLYLALNGPLLLPVVSSFCDSGQLGEEAEGASSTTSYNCRIILVGGACEGHLVQERTLEMCKQALLL